MYKIEYEIEPTFKIDFFKIKCVDFKNKKKKLINALNKYPETLQNNFYSNRNKCDLNKEFLEIFVDEFNLISTKHNCTIKLQTTWSVTYHKGHYHVPHNHGSKGYCGILYLDMKPNSPRTTYIQPWNNEKDMTVLHRPKVSEGDIMIVPQHLWHFTEPNKINFKKRILSFDFYEL